MKLLNIPPCCFLICLFVISASCKKSVEGYQHANTVLSIANLKVVVADLPNDQYMHLTFVNPSTGFAVSNHGLIIKTIDEGKKWQIVASLGADMLFTKIQFTDEQHGFVIGGDSNGGYLFKTVDGGVNWIKKEFNPIQAGVPNDMFFINKDTGFVVGVNLFIKTTDGGVTWTNTLASNGYNFNNVCFKNAVEGYVTSNNGIYFKTIDGGLT